MQSKLSRSNEDILFKLLLILVFLLIIRNVFESNEAYMVLLLITAFLSFILFLRRKNKLEEKASPLPQQKPSSHTFFLPKKVFSDQTMMNVNNILREDYYDPYSQAHDLTSQAQYTTQNNGNYFRNSMINQVVGSNLQQRQSVVFQEKQKPKQVERSEIQPVRNSTTLNYSVRRSRASIPLQTNSRHSISRGRTTVGRSSVMSKVFNQRDARQKLEY